MSPATRFASVATLVAGMGAWAADPPGAGRKPVPGPEAWGEVRVTADRMPAASFAISPSGTEIAFFGVTQAYYVYDIPRAHITREVRADKSVYDLAYAPDGKVLATTEWSDGVRLRDPQTGAVRDTLAPGDDLGATSVGFLPDGKLAAYCWRSKAGAGSPMTERLAVWDPASGRAVGWPKTERTDTGGHMIRRWFVARGRFLLSVETRSDRGYVIARSVTLTDPATNRATAPVTQDLDDFVLDASPDGRTLLVGNPARPPRLVDAGSGKTTQILVGHRQMATCGAFSPDGRLVVTASGPVTTSNPSHTSRLPAGTPTDVILWDATTGGAVAALREEAKGFDYYKVDFSPDGKFVVAVARPEVPVRGQRRGGQMVLWGRLPARVSKPAASPAPPPRVVDDPFPLSDRLDRLVQDLAGGRRPADQQVEAVFLATLGRLPTEDERRLAAAGIRGPADPEGLRRLLAALTGTREFREHAEGLQKRLGEAKPSAPRP